MEYIFPERCFNQIFWRYFWVFGLKRCNCDSLLGYWLRFTSTNALLVPNIHRNLLQKNCNYKGTEPMSSLSEREQMLIKRPMHISRSTLRALWHNTMEILEQNTCVRGLVVQIGGLIKWCMYKKISYGSQRFRKYGEFFSISLCFYGFYTKKQFDDKAIWNQVFWTKQKNYSFTEVEVKRKQRTQ